MEPDPQRSAHDRDERGEQRRPARARVVERETNSCDPATTAASDASLAELCQTFAAATGWRLHLRPRRGAAEHADRLPPNAQRDADLDYQVHLARSKDGPPPANSRAAAMKLATALAGNLAMLARTRRALRASEAELAAGVPIYIASSQAGALADRLEAILRGGARAAGCTAAGLYLLDEGTSCLKLRASWGLPAERLSDPPRRLATELADLEALLGHAVVLEDIALQASWPVPEPCAAAICLPVAAESTLLGTAWFFAPQPGTFDDRETELLEIVAGRLAVELELAMLRSAVAAGRRDAQA
ncbi:MAG: GAF domain-containing protein [Pirellulales bacterium]|nr:GAF domain-containing protein [Pirellulales bacterium]